MSTSIEPHLKAMHLYASGKSKDLCIFFFQILSYMAANISIVKRNSFSNSFAMPLGLTGR